MNKAELRKNFGIPQDANVIMTTMRNQKRKLFPDLIDMFAQLMKSYVASQNTAALRNTYLYLHTSYPDVGYDIGRHIMQSGVGHKILVSYLCENCRGFYPDLFQGEITNCRYCGAAAAHMPNTAFGVERHQLAQLYNLADLYIQYSICEGFGMVLAEAKACGVPAMAVDYSAMSEQVNTFGCFPIKVERFFYESVVETEQRRALPDNNDAVKKIREFFNLSPDTRRAMSDAVRKDAATNHSFDRAAKVFEDAIDNTPIHDRATTWDNTAPQYMPCNTNIPKSFRSSDQMLDWCFVNILGRDPNSDIAFRNDLLKGINTGVMLGRRGKESFDANKAIRMMVDMANNNNKWESARVAAMAPHVGAEWINV
jgi:hypothetical protein